MHVRKLSIMAAILLVCCILYMTLGSRGNWGFVLPFRGNKLIALLLVSGAVSTSTVLFQTITRNRILTPSIMGIDTLYVLILTTTVFFLGGQGYVQLPALGVFVVNVVVLILAAILLFGTLLGKAGNDMMRLLLTGVIFATLFRSLTSFMQRMIDPNEYTVIQVGSYARFARIDTELLSLAVVLLLGTLLAVWVMRHRLDVLALGHDAAINLGEDPKRGQFQALALVAILVAVSTSLVGPIAFLGLIVVSVAHILIPTAHHAVLLPSAALISAITLVGGQTIMERVFALSTPLSVVIDFVGGFLFLLLLLKRGAR
jgi:iron-siderophore transport system permease protein